MSFEAIDTSLFFSRNDSLDLRLGDFAQLISRDQIFNKSASTVIAGYPDDEGIALNGGRIGACQAPDQIRRSLYKMTPDLFTAPRFISPENAILDLGNLVVHSTDGTSIATRHEVVRSTAHEALKLGHRWVGLGGGHDYGFADGAAFLSWAETQQRKPIVINFDAHLDVRPLDKGLTSGTPFFRLLQEFMKSPGDFDFVEIGIQPQCNSRTHYDWAQSHGALILSWPELAMGARSWDRECLHRLSDLLLQSRPAFVSVDIDGFSSAFAMGCSQSWSTGFDPDGFFRVFDVILKRLDVRMLGVYEVSPPLDHDHRTSKLAAQIVHRFLTSC